MLCIRRRIRNTAMAIPGWRKESRDYSIIQRIPHHYRKPLSSRPQWAGSEEWRTPSAPRLSGGDYRVFRVVALPAPTEREQTQWYFQRYAVHLPAGGEMVLFDRSWYNRAGVERVMGFCTDEEYREFLRSCPEFERMLVRSGIQLLKYWFSVSDEEQERRFQARIHDPTKQWKLSPMDLESRSRWIEYSKAKDEMFAHTDIKQAPWYVVDADDKKRARLNVISHLLSMVDYEDVPREPVKLPPRQDKIGYVRPPIGDQTFVPPVY